MRRPADKAREGGIPGVFRPKRNAERLAEARPVAVKRRSRQSTDRLDDAAGLKRRLQSARAAWSAAHDKTLTCAVALGSRYITATAIRRPPAFGPPCRLKPALQAVPAIFMTGGVRRRTGHGRCSRWGPGGMHRRSSPHRENWAAWVLPPAVNNLRTKSRAVRSGGGWSPRPVGSPSTARTPKWRGPDGIASGGRASSRDEGLQDPVYGISATTTDRSPRANPSSRRDSAPSWMPINPNSSIVPRTSN